MREYGFFEGPYFRRNGTTADFKWIDHFFYYIIKEISNLNNDRRKRVFIHMNDVHYYIT